MSILEEISEFLQKGKRKNVKALIEQALEEGIDPKIILKEGLMSGMSIIGGKFKREEVFVPDVMMAGYECGSEYSGTKAGGSGK